MMQQIIKSPITGEFKLLETNIDSSTAYLKIASNMVSRGHSKAWFVFWETLNDSQSFTFSLPYNVRMEEWEEEELESLGYEIKWNTKAGCHDVIVYPSKGD